MNYSYSVLAGVHAGIDMVSSFVFTQISCFKLVLSFVKLIEMVCGNAFARVSSTQNYFKFSILFLT